MPPLSNDEGLRFVTERHWGVLVTLKASDGRPQLSNVAYATLAGRVRVSVTATRAKTANVRKDPRVSLHVASADFWTYVVVEGTAELSAVAAEPGDETCRTLLELYELVTAAAHPNPEEFFAAMVEERRLQLAFPIDHVYPVMD